MDPKSDNFSSNIGSSVGNLFLCLNRLFCGIFLLGVKIYSRYDSLPLKKFLIKHNFISNGGRRVNIQCKYASLGHIFYDNGFFCPDSSIHIKISKIWYNPAEFRAIAQQLLNFYRFCNNFVTYQSYLMKMIKDNFHYEELFLCIISVICLCFFLKCKPFIS